MLGSYEEKTVTVEKSCLLSFAVTSPGGIVFNFDIVPTC